MTQNAVLETTGEFPPEQGKRTLRLDLVPSTAVMATAPAVTLLPTAVPFDAVRVLSEVMNRPGSLLQLSSDTPIKRPFDAQYWACWFAAVVFPVLMAYLWISR